MSQKDPLPGDLPPSVMRDWNAAIGMDPSTHPPGCHCPHPTCLAFHAARKAASDAETAAMIRELEARRKK